MWVLGSYLSGIHKIEFQQSTKHLKVAYFHDLHDFHLELHGKRTIGYSIQKKNPWLQPILDKINLFCSGLIPYFRQDLFGFI